MADGESVPSSIFYNEVFMWGRGSFGQLGTGDKKKMKRPTKVKALSRMGIIQFSTGGNHSAGVTAAGHLYVWGSGDKGCLGRGDHANLPTPRKLLLPNQIKVSSVACGEYHTCFLTFEGAVFTVGSNCYGQLGLGHLSSCTIPNKIEMLDDKHISRIFCGNHQTACIDSDGLLYTWGDSRSGQLGHGFFFPQNTPKVVDPISHIRFTSIDFGSSHAVALTRDGEVYVWGKTGYDIGADTIPRPAPSLETNIAQVQSGKYHIAVLTTGGKVLTWGCGLHGQLGLCDKEDKSTPWLVRMMFEYRVVSICCGEFHTMALTESGQLFTWGDNQKFSCGRDPDRKDCPAPGEVVLPAENQVLQMVAGGLSAGVLLGLRNGTTYEDVGTMTSLPRIRYVASGESKPLKVLIASWNINAQSTPDMSPWLRGEIEADIIAVGFQELIELTSHSVAQDEAKSQIVKAHLVRDKVCKYWAKLLLGTLNDEGIERYKLLKDVRLAGVYLAVFIKTSLRSPVYNLRSSFTKVGVLGKLGNKGGVAIRFSLYDSSNTICFVHSHLAAGQSHVDKRNADYINIASSLRFQVDKEKFSVFDHQKIFWLGDLNYRIEMPRDEAEKLIARQDWKALYPHDQLLVEREEGRVFEGFSEPPIYFPPTYKYDPGTDQFDSSEKHRIPAWCDRILYRGDDISPLLYRSHQECLDSDHKPVTAWFSIVVKEHNMTKRLAELNAFSEKMKAERASSLPSYSEENESHESSKSPSVSYRKRFASPPNKLKNIQVSDEEHSPWQSRRHSGTPRADLPMGIRPKEDKSPSNWKKVRPVLEQSKRGAARVGADFKDSSTGKSLAKMAKNPKAKLLKKMSGNRGDSFLLEDDYSQ